MEQIKEKMLETMGLKGEIKALEQERKAIETLAQQAASRYRHRGRKKGNLASPVEVGVLDLLSLEEEIGQKQQNFVQEYRQVSQAIASVTDPTQRTILRLRYLHGAPWKLICHETQYSWGGVHYKHRQALAEIKQQGYLN